MQENNEKARLKENILNDLDIIIGKIIDNMFEWGKAKGKREKDEGNENVEFTDFEKTCLFVDASIAIDKILHDCVYKSVEMGIKCGIKEYETEYEQGVEQGCRNVFKNIIKGHLKMYEKDGLIRGIQFAKKVFPEWDDDKFQSELAVLQKDLNIDLNPNEYKKLLKSEQVKT